MPPVTDTLRIRSILETDRDWSAFALADLEPAYSERAVWFQPSGGVSALVLLYWGFDIPILTAVGNAEDLESVLGEVDAALEGRPKVYFAVKPDLFALLGRRYHVGESKEMMRMVLDPDRFRAGDSRGVDRLSRADLQDLQRLYADGEAAGESPEFFLPSMLETGLYFAIREEGEWVSVAGTHVLANEMKVAGLGNIYTRRDKRGSGLGTRVTGVLGRTLLERGIQTVALNVSVKNHAAVRVYERIGFRPRVRYLEAVALRPEQA